MKISFILFSLWMTHIASAEVRDLETLCGKDDRVPSQVKTVARMMKRAGGTDGGCTGTLISKSCMISAGHCEDYLKIAQFDVPMSSSNGAVNHPSIENQYDVEQVVGVHYTNGSND